MSLLPGLGVPGVLVNGSIDPLMLPGDLENLSPTDGRGVPGG